ncbi:MAG: hypothetical protein ACP5OV_08290 [Acidimicrobiales bacterium]
MTALIYGPSVIGGDGNLGTSGSLEQTILQSEGYSVTIATAAQWDAMTSAQFASYQLLVIGDPQCGSGGLAADSNESTWMSAVNGNVIVIGTDPAYHYAFGNNNAGAYATAQAGLRYAGSDTAATNLYLDLSCAFQDPSAVSPPILNGLESGFVVVGALANSDGNTADVTVAGANALGLTAAQLSGWNDSVHEDFTAWPADFTPLAVVGGSPSPMLAPRAHAVTSHISLGSLPSTCSPGVLSVTMLSGCPYILARNGVAAVGGAVRDLTVSRTVTTLTATWQAGGSSAPFVCTLLYGYHDPSTFTVHTTATQCSFYDLSPAISYGVGVAGDAGAGPSSSAFAGPVRTTITCRLGWHMRHITGIAPHCPARWHLVG